MVELGPFIPLFSELKFTNYLQGLISDDIMMGFLCKLYLIFGDSVPVQQSKLQLDVRHPVVCPGQVEHEGLVEDRVQGSLFNVSFLLGNPLFFVKQIYLHVGI